MTLGTTLGFICLVLGVGQLVHLLLGLIGRPSHKAWANRFFGASGLVLVTVGVILTVVAWAMPRL